MDGNALIAYVVVPLVIAFVGGAAAAITALVRFVSYMARSQVAQEKTAESNEEISKKLDKFIDHTTEVLSSYGERFAILEHVTGIQNGKRRYPE